MKKSMKKLIVPSLIGFYILLQPPVQAQHTVKNSIFSSGGAVAADETNQLFCTVGQPISGETRSDSYIHQIGFWYQAVDLITGVEQIQDVLPVEFRLDQNYPNPFNPTTTIRFAVPQKARVTLKIYDILGREAATLVDEEMQPGDFQLVFDASDLASGVYFYRLQAERFSQLKKLILLR